MLSTYPHPGTRGSKSNFTSPFPSPIGDFALQGTKPSTGVFLCTSKTLFTFLPPLSWQAVLLSPPNAQIKNQFQPSKKSVLLSKHHQRPSSPSLTQRIRGLRIKSYLCSSLGTAFSNFFRVLRRGFHSSEWISRIVASHTPALFAKALRPSVIAQERIV